MPTFGVDMELFSVMKISNDTRPGVVPDKVLEFTVRGDLGVRTRAELESIRIVLCCCRTVSPSTIQLSSGCEIT